MQDNSANSRDFNPMSVAGLSGEARQVVNTAFDAMSAWRIDIANSNEKNSEQVIEKMAAAARALGWPEQIVDATHAQLQSLRFCRGRSIAMISAAVTTGAQRSASLRIVARISSGVFPTGSSNGSANRARTSGIRRTCAIASESRLVIASGVRGGATIRSTRRQYF